MIRFLESVTFTMPKTTASQTEEIASSITHGVGAALSLVGLIVLVTLASGHDDARSLVSLAMYGTTLILLYLCSMFYHAFRAPRVKQVFRYLDHSAIFLLIAGTYTPFTLVNLRGAWGWILFGVIWGLATAGILMTVLLPGRSRILASLVYIGMGWMVVIAIRPLMATVPFGGIMLLVAGGLAYTFGVIFYIWKKLPYNHAIWHLFVLGGSACHFFAVLWYVLPAG